jgi:hypothetical protein
MARARLDRRTVACVRRFGQAPRLAPRYFAKRAHSNHRFVSSSSRVVRLPAALCKRSTFSA